MLSVFILLQGGILSLQYVVKLTHHKRVIEKKIENGLLNEQLVTFTFEEMINAEWENDHEFFLGDEKFDVVKVSGDGQNVVYRCVSDEIEKNLIKDLEKTEKKSNLVEKLFQKVHLQSQNIPLFIFTDLSFENIVQSVFYKNDYSFQFSGFIIKPPIF